MQLQIEHHSSLSPRRQTCLICNTFFQPNLARVIVCDRDGDAYGDVCTTCLAKGAAFVQGSLQELLPSPSGLAGVP